MNGLDCIFPRRIDHAHHAHQGQTGFQVSKFQFTVVIPDTFNCNGKYTLAPARHGMYLLLPIIPVDRDVVATGPLQRTQVTQPFRCTLDVGKTVPGMIMMQCGHVAVFGFERNHVGTRPSLLFESRIHSRLDAQGQQCTFGRVAMQDPFTIMLMQGSIVAQQGRARQLGKDGVVFQYDFLVVDQEQAG